MRVLKNAALEDDGYSGFSQEVIDSGELEPVAGAITKLVIDKGEGALSPKTGNCGWCDHMLAKDN